MDISVEVCLEEGLRDSQTRMDDINRSRQYKIERFQAGLKLFTGFICMT